jgi:hypothetical protein
VLKAAQSVVVKLAMLVVDKAEICVVVKSATLIAMDAPLEMGNVVSANLFVDTPTASSPLTLRYRSDYG